MLDIPPAILQRINDTPAMLSFLYDVDLMPEQIRDKTALRTLLIAVAAFDAGARTEKEPK